MVLSRRRVLMGWTAAMAGAAVTGCAQVHASVSGAGRAGPTSARGPTVITVKPYGDSAGTAEQTSFLQHFLGLFNQKHKGIEARLFGGAAGMTGAARTAILSGSGPDVYDEWQLGQYLPLMLDLGPFIRESNLNLGQFSKSQLSLTRIGSTQYGLPTSTGSVAMIVNTGLLNELGLSLPSRHWDYKEHAALATRVAGTMRKAGPFGTHRWGTTIFTPLNYANGADYRRWGASRVAAGNAMKCGLRTPEAIAFGEWAKGLITDGVATTVYHYKQGLLAGQWAMTGLWTGGLLHFVQIAQAAGVQWDIWPLPAGPAHRASFVNHDSYMIPAASPHHREAWQFIYWFMTDPAAQRFYMSTYMLPPSNKALYAEYGRRMVDIAPPLRGKYIQGYLDPVEQDWVYASPRFAYSNPQAEAIVMKWWNKIVPGLGSRFPVPGGMSVTEGFTQAADEVDALEAAAAVTAGAVKRARHAFPVRGRPTARVTAGL